MSDKDKEILLAKIDALRWSFSDTQLQAIMSTLNYLVSSIPSTDRNEIGFRGKGNDK